MKLKMQFIFFLLLSFFLAKSQTIIQGVIKNEENKTLSYCAIGIKDTNVGTITDEKGFYKIIIPNEFQNKNVIINAEGYLEQSFNLLELKANPNVILKFKTENIKEVILTAKKLKEKTIGQKSRPIITFSKMFDKNVPTIEQGNIFEIYKKTKLNYFSFHIIPSSKYEQITLKLNIYSVKNSLPDESILNENIIFKTSSTGWQIIDLSKYKLIFNNLDEIAITLQLVDYTPLKDTDFVFGISAKKSLSKNLMFRFQSQSQWKKSEGTFLTNINVGYDKKGKTNIDHKIMNDEPTENHIEKELISFYKGREEGLKTIYGKNPNGKYIDLEDAKIYFEEYGSGEPLILLEGNNGLISDFYNQISFFSKQFRVIAIDTRGQGKSLDFAKNDYGYEKLSDDLQQIVKRLKLQKVNIIGWSDGGITGLIFNSKNPNLVNKLVTIGANTNPEGVKDALLQSIKQGYENSNDEREKRRLNLMINYPNITIDDLRKIKNPVLIVAGDEDDIKQEHTAQIAERIDNAKLEIIENSTHNIPFEQPKILNKKILDFLKK
ncbi:MULTISPECIES: alpha/beta fold hydrolase [unclassified Kaistella]|uniref:alpha/beta fold hydrolase n=1 Tax=unclassified Kaistella TaxID=2762626 RepID=UPI0027330CD4|nr:MULTISPECIES: alpha/beta fold hydrolase [unclassified Kaistella]MDP2455211.1 alpha/beta fold hydrolase [Kaistella sp. SH11-4b]MDP2458058.1 alpha/beta fold hydrolase [Kaistella sp. SH40-3]MDP2461025.1 alpha/beta fold hydrolase [Kaistella sp. SH19-2b]